MMDELYSFLMQSDLQHNKIKILDEYITNEEYDSEAIKDDIIDVSIRIQSNIADQDIDIFDCIKRYLYIAECMLNIILLLWLNSFCYYGFTLMILFFDNQRIKERSQ